MTQCYSDCLSTQPSPQCSMLPIRATTLSCLVVLGLVAACGDHSIPTPVTCNGVGIELCGDSCVSTVSDPKHCGGCDKACATGEVCSAGTCTPKCFIDGVLHASGAPNPGNACETCVPETSTTRWTARASVP